ncbi:unnamed protein product [Pleuronectes platessa]|uniref:Uncharacterized protein n=1 Tax=Pleuronectes platessa TaxID=8262 RepID=A0A9N7TZ26_PLEPL|nr:unnamed protein product [Pleuronectes platessa]
MSSTTMPPPALSAFPSDTVRTGPSADLQVAPLAGKCSIQTPAHSQIQAQPHSYLFHKLRSKCRCWQIRPGFGTALLQQLLSRNSPSMPC